ncbi:hypothetical protein [Streptomyces sp. N35]|uniref:hypothetical protein n=1 Tax=Streptomyces sp. N35 TaxID=2795730 RepID=UPI0018F407E0|nr:hypothetical protein [Streptomyces sp. N35]
MPRRVKRTRQALSILGGSQLLVGLLLVVGNRVDSVPIDVSSIEPFSMGGQFTAGAMGLTAVVFAAKFGTGRAGVRWGAMILAGLVIATGIFGHTGGRVFNLFALALGLHILVNCARQQTASWFARPRP